MAPCVPAGVAGGIASSRPARGALPRVTQTNRVSRPRRPAGRQIGASVARESSRILALTQPIEMVRSIVRRVMRNAWRSTAAVV